MVELILHARECISCGICADVCAPRALQLRISRRIGIEGARRSLVAMGTFPWLASAHSCDGCMLCVNECPVSAIALRFRSEA